MRWMEYWKDRLPACLICAAAWVLMLIFLSAFHVPLQAVFLVSVIFFLAAVTAQLWDFLRRKRSYDKLLHCLRELDQKYLIAEMMEKPDFYDGQILYEALWEADKSMCEQIARYRRENTEFREYIELWVHEIKLPVASMQLMCHNDHAEKYAGQLRRMDGCIENVLYYARSGNAEKDYIIKAVSLKRVFASVAVKNREELQQRHITLRTENLEVQVMTDSKWLEYIFGQLMGNSMKYEATEITVTAVDCSDKTMLQFRDNGIGIPARDLPYIFEKSFTGENGRTHAKSTGMGLYIVKKLCDKLGHGITAESVPGEYTAITISFGKNDLYAVSLQNCKVP